MMCAPSLRSLVRSVAVLCILGSTTSNAAEFCVDSATELQAALTTAASNGQDDQVKIVQGTYVGNFVYATATEAHALEVLGGYTSECSSRELDPTNTVLDGNQAGTVLALSVGEADGDLLVQGLMIQKGSRATGDGGGLYAKVDGYGAVTIDSNAFKNNATPDSGGGAYVYTKSGINISNNIFLENTASYGGGAYIICRDACYNYNNSLYLYKNNFQGNRASSDGGGVYVTGLPANISSNIFQSNSSDGYNGGGGAYIESAFMNSYAKITFANNSLRGNTAFGKGSGLTIVAHSSAAHIINNLFNFNISREHGSTAEIQAWSNLATVSNNSFHGNINSDTYNNIIGALVLRLGSHEGSSNAMLYNNIFWKNILALGAIEEKGGDICIFNDDDNDFLPTPVTLISNNFDQSSVGFYSQSPIAIDSSNLNAIDPLFINEDSGDLRLQPSSPMIDAGNSSSPNLPEIDLDDNPRIADVEIDIGAYEYQDANSAIYLLSVAKAGFGTVTSDLAGIDCGTDCLERYADNAIVTLTATPETGHDFIGWGGACANSGTQPNCTLTMNSAHRVVAAFDSHPFNRQNNNWKVTEIYIATLGYAPDDEGLQYWVDWLDESFFGWTPLSVAQSFFDQSLVWEIYPPDQDYGVFIEALYQNIYGRSPDQAGYDYWLEELSSGRIARNQMIISLIEAGWSNTTPEARVDMQRFGHRVEVALAFAAYQSEHGIVYSALDWSTQEALRQAGQDVLRDVTADPSTRDQAIARLPMLLGSLHD